MVVQIGGMVLRLLYEVLPALAGTLIQRNGVICHMKELLIKLSVKLDLLKDSLKQEDGQDLIEYALLVALVAFAATAGMSVLAKDINTAFTSIGTTLTTYTG
jgi:pilus assembly protein Flp/PilA